jgi:hypothetical protein
MFFMLGLYADAVHACTCVTSTDSKSAISDAPVVFVGTVLKSELLRQHPEMRGRRRYAVTFRVREYWKGTRERTLKLYDVDPGTDCLGAGFEAGKQYLVYASEQPVKDTSFDDFFWIGWTDVLAKGATMLQPMMACMPGGNTKEPLVQKTLRELGRGHAPHAPQKE